MSIAGDIYAIDSWHAPSHPSLGGPPRKGAAYKQERAIFPKITSSQHVCAALQLLALLASVVIAAAQSSTSLPRLYAFTIRQTYQHDPDAFTQGLEYDQLCSSEGNCTDVLWESTGRLALASPAVEPVHAFERYYTCWHGFAHLPESSGGSEIMKYLKSRYTHTEVIWKCALLRHEWQVLPAASGAGHGSCAAHPAAACPGLWRGPD